MHVDLRTADSRFPTRIDWLKSAHSFSFGHHYDADNTHFGLLLVNNDDWIARGSGFERHPHREMEIVTWVLQGEVVHQDSAGNNGLITPGLAQRMSAGKGIFHSEKNDRRDTDLHLVQMWVVPDSDNTGGAAGLPTYGETDISALLDSGELVPVASGRGHDAAISIRQKDAVLWAARLRAGQGVALPEAPYVHVFVAEGAVDLEGGGRLNAGDAARITAAEAATLTAPESAEVLIWEMHSALGD